MYFLIIVGCIWLCLVEIVQQSGEEVRRFSMQCLNFKMICIYICKMLSEEEFESSAWVWINWVWITWVWITRLNPQPLPWHGLDNPFAGLSQDPRVPRWRSQQQWLLGLVRFLARFRLNILYHLLRLHSLLNIWKWFDLSCEKILPFLCRKVTEVRYLH